ncbi:MAG: hypothetical protein N3G80_02090 [Candidatus Micrarchaeota archaeon]|nr:hypothetical protein [Candidatus Micrarchaeota archaeon]
MDFRRAALAALTIAAVDQFFSLVSLYANQQFYADEQYFFLWNTNWVPWNPTLESLIFPISFSLLKGIVFLYAFFAFTRKDCCPTSFGLIIFLLSGFIPIFSLFLFFAIPVGFLSNLLVQQFAVCMLSSFFLYYLFPK